MGTTPTPKAPAGATRSETQRAAVEYASRALFLAGYALSAPTPSLADRRLGQLLLRECRKACGEARGEPEAPLFSLEAEEPPSADALRATERELALRVKALYGERNPRRLASWVGLAFGAVALLVLSWIVVGALMPRPEYENYLWRSSSGVAGFPRAGKLHEHGTSDLICHTDNEPNPWLVVDTILAREISQVIVQNRADCCPERGLPMVVEVGLDGSTYEEVGRTAKIFDTWQLDFKPRRARFVRIRAEATTVIQLRGVIVR
jgi:hypothetical protein